MRRPHGRRPTRDGPRRPARPPSSDHDRDHAASTTPSVCARHMVRPGCQSPAGSRGREHGPRPPPTTGPAGSTRGRAFVGEKPRRCWRSRAPCARSRVRAWVARSRGFSRPARDRERRPRAAAAATEAATHRAKSRLPKPVAPQWLTLADPLTVVDRHPRGASAEGEGEDLITGERHGVAPRSIL